MKIDIEKLRSDMMDDYGTAMFSGFPMAVVELSQVENASPQALIDMAERRGIDLSEYADDDDEDDAYSSYYGFRRF
jgi:hypothetical protein